VIGNQGSSAYTAIGGHGIYNVRQPPGTGGIYIPGNFLADPGDGSNPGGWSLGTDGIAVEAYLAEWSAADLADIAAIVWPWFESDSTREYSEGVFWQAGAQKFLALVRGMLGRTAASLPLAWWDPIAFWTNPGIPDDPQRDAGDVVAFCPDRSPRDASHRRQQPARRDLGREHRSDYRGGRQQPPGRD
jgi:hypothetical protein